MRIDAFSFECFNKDFKRILEIKLIENVNQNLMTPDFFNIMTEIIEFNCS